MKKQSILYILLAITILLFSASTYVYAIDKNKETFIFLGNEDIAPLIYNENNEAQGLVVDIIKGLNSKVDFNIEVQAINWEEAQDRILSKKADGLLHFNPTLKREKIYDFSTELLESEFSIFKRYGDETIRNVYDLKDKNVGVELSGYPQSILEDYKNINVVIIPSWIEGFKMIELGLLDALVVDRWIGEYALTKNKISKIEIVEEPIETRYSYIALPKDNDYLLGQINEGLEKMRSDGTMDKILRKWKGENVVYFTENEIKKNIYYVLLGLAVIFALVSMFLVSKLRKTNHELEIKVKERTKELNETNKKLKKIATIDALTNIPNRRHFDTIFKKTWKMSLREKQPLSLILLDIDYFKRCNDTYGHLGGDSYLKSLAKVLKDSVKRPGDIVARFGGEEFIIMLFNTPEKGAMILAEKIRELVENTTVDYEGEEIKQTVSLGVATIIPSENLDSMDLIRLADQALYQAKSKGRNQVIMLDHI